MAAQRTARAESFVQSGARPSFVGSDPTVGLRSAELMSQTDPATTTATAVDPAAANPTTVDPAATSPAVADPAATNAAAPVTTEGVPPTEPVTPPPANDALHLNQAGDPMTQASLAESIGRATGQAGERVSVDLHLEGAANVSGSPLEVGGWADLGLSASRSDAGTVNLSFNYEAAVKAGIDLGPLEFDVGAGVTGEVTARFNSPQDAAGWLGGQMQGLNNATGANIFNVEGNFSGERPTVVNSVGGFAQAEGSLTTSPGVAPDGSTASFGDISISGQARIEANDVTYSVPQPDGSTQTFEGFERNTELGGGISVDLGNGVTVAGNYQYTATQRRGDPNPDNNGNYRNHNLSFTVDAQALHRAGPAGLERLVQAGLGLDGAPAVGTPEHARYTRALESANTQAGVAARGDITFNFETNQIFENGRYENQYSRLSASLSRGVTASADLHGVGEGEISVSRTDTQVLGEWAGAETESYAQTVFNGPDNAAWDRFRENNRPQLETMLQSRPANDPARLAYEQGGLDAGITALEQDWTAGRAQTAEVQRAAEQFEIENGSFFGRSERELLEQMQGFSGRPEAAAQFLDELNRRGLSDQELLSMWGPTSATGGHAGRNAATNREQRGVVNALMAEAAGHRSFHADARQASDTILDSMNATFSNPERTILNTLGGLQGNPQALNETLDSLANMGITENDLLRSMGPTSATSGHAGRNARVNRQQQAELRALFQIASQYRAQQGL